MRDYIQELADYFQVTPEIARQRHSIAPEEIKRKWIGRVDTDDFHRCEWLVYRMMRPRPKVDECLKSVISYSLTRGDRKILDYGCGVGSYLIPLAEAGFEVEGVEVKGSAVLNFTRWRLKRRYLDNPVYEHDSPFKEGSYDAILFYDVLEHLDKPFMVVKLLHNLLKSKGILYMTYSPHGELTNLKEINEECLPFLNKQYYRLDNERWLHK